MIHMVHMHIYIIRYMAIWYKNNLVEANNDLGIEVLYIWKVLKPLKM